MDNSSIDDISPLQLALNGLINLTYFAITLPNKNGTTHYSNPNYYKGQYLVFSSDGNMICNSDYEFAQYINQNNQCQCKKKNYYPFLRIYQIQIYSECSNKNCHSCENLVNCTLCRYSQIARILPDCICPQGYYETNESYECLSCPIQCETCLSETNCLKCKQSLRILPLCECQIGYTDDSNGNCVKCQFPCLTCKNQTNQCTKCVYDKNRMLNNNCQCKIGYFEDEKKKCQKCSPICQQCFGQKNNCTKLDIILSGIQTSGRLHLGNYLGAIKNWVSLQEKYHDKGAEIYLFLADSHAITDKFKMGPDQEFELTLKNDTIEMMATLIAAGIDPKKSTIFLQSMVPQHAELTWLFNCIGPLHWLNTMIQFKEKKTRNSSIGLYNYPVLMASDILLYKATKVPVGDDQKQHLELTRQFADRYNANYPRVMSLRDGKKKMSKSEISDNSRINLTDDPEVIYDKIRRAKTDSIQSINAGENRPEVTNLLKIYASVTDRSVESIEQEYQGKNMKQFKDGLAENLIKSICPIGLKIETLMEDEESLRQILVQGSQKASQTASQNIKEIKEKMGFLV
ncbi:Insulin-like growth factor binding protein, N-terminal [Pseudocohnilembus persalinus]|uniref:tryptophan--tRNA ligase n=1 Tax=Pseudocohnilembus persalinus TaxID=266149 RepID=A0A0V0QG03_PSEPJ|nr:Insulin-like growth factor binding protein, N-terminal [Pseudocohnilembus persalinus]|eukprot:KRX01142.1 Insulin-like growth factor binding protein, N-terminal [Pseudocohnilembus persalinus]